MMEDQDITTDQLQDQANTLVQQAAAVLGTGGATPSQAATQPPITQQLAQTDSAVDASSLIAQGSTPEAQNKIASLLGQISQLTGKQGGQDGSNQADSGNNQLDPSILSQIASNMQSPPSDEAIIQTNQLPQGE